MTGGASSSACSETFGGRAAGSEPEVQAVTNHLLTLKGDLEMYMSFHSYGQWWFTPYGYQTSTSSDYAKQFALAKIGADAIKRVNNKAYAVGSVAQLLYIASGSSVDYAADVLGCPWSYTIELPPTQNQASIGFQWPEARAAEVAKETYIGMVEFMKAVLNEVTSK